MLHPCQKDPNTPGGRAGRADAGFKLGGGFRRGADDSEQWSEAETGGRRNRGPELEAKDGHCCRDPVSDTFDIGYPEPSTFQPGYPVPNPLYLGNRGNSNNKKRIDITPLDALTIASSITVMDDLDRLRYDRNPNPNPNPNQVSDSTRPFTD